MVFEEDRSRSGVDHCGGLDVDKGEGRLIKLLKSVEERFVGLHVEFEDRELQGLVEGQLRGVEWS